MAFDSHKRQESLLRNDAPGLSVKTIRAVLAAVLAAVAPLEQVFLGEHQEALVRIVEILRVELRAAVIVVHGCHSTQRNNGTGEKFKDR
jgi:hypothetical protein